MIFNHLLYLIKKYAAQILILALMIWMIFIYSDDLYSNYSSDEAYTVSYTQHSHISETINDIRKNEETPLAYFVSTNLWSKLFGNSEFPLRILSFIYGLIAAFIYYHFAEKKFSLFSASLSTIILILSSVFSGFIFTARSYILMILLTMICIYIFEKIYAHPLVAKWYIYYSISATTLLLTNYFSVVIIISQLTLLLYRIYGLKSDRRKSVFLLVCTIGVVSLGFLPWVPIVLYQLRVSSAVTGSLASGTQTYIWLCLAFFVEISILNPYLPISGGIAALIWAFVLYGIYRSHRLFNGLVFRTFTLPLLLLITILILTGAFATRYLLVVAPGIALSFGAAWELFYKRQRRLAYIFGTLIIIGLIFDQSMAYARRKPIYAWSHLQSYIAQAADPAGDCVLFHPPWDQRTFEYYYTGPEVCLLGAHHYDDFFYTQGYTFMRSWTEQEAVAAVQHTRRVWVFDNYEYALPRLVLPYPVVDEWQDGALHLTLYAVHSARP